MPPWRGSLWAARLRQRRRLGQDAWTAQGTSHAGLPADEKDASSLASTRYDVSVIIIGWQVRDEVLASLDSVSQHRGGLSVQAIYVDNGSSDGTADAVSEQFPDVTLVRLPRNIGMTARNHGLRLARGRFRMFLDSDAMLTPGALEIMASVLDASPSTGLVGPKLIYPDGGLQLSARRYPPLALPLLRRPPLSRFFDDGPTVRRHLMADDPPSRRQRVEYVLGACQMFRQEAQAAVGEIDPRIWYGPDDCDWCFRIRRAGFDVEYVPDAVVIHDYRRTTAATPLSRVSLRHLRAHVYCQLKWLPARRMLLQQGRAMDAEALA